MSVEGALERGGSQWEPIKEHDLRDGKDLYTLHAEFNGVDANSSYQPSESEFRRFAGRTGLILRRANDALGYVLYKVHPNGWVNRTEQACVLYIPELFIQERARNAGTGSKLLQSLRQTALENNAKYIGWTTGSPMMVDLTAKLGNDATDMGQLQFLPIEQFDITKLIELTRAKDL